MSTHRVRFTNTTLGGATSYLWDFSDGTTSTETNPVHTFARDTTYNVVLTAYRGSDSDTAYQTLNLLSFNVDFSWSQPGIFHPDFSWVQYPNDPTRLRATVVSATQINLTWQDTNLGETGTKIERYTDGSSFSQIATRLPNVVTYSDSTLTAGTDYHYRVRAYNSIGDSSYSNVVDATTPTLLPAAPTGLIATALPWDSYYLSRIKLDWTNNAVNASYNEIERSSDGTSYSSYTLVGASWVSYTLPFLTAPITYWFRVKAVNGYGSSAYTNIASATTQGVPVAKFMWGVDLDNTSRINFTDLSLLNPTSWDWSWGDGSTNGNTRNPSHIYADSSNYSVTLTATNASGSSSSTQNVTTNPVVITNTVSASTLCNQWEPAGETWANPGYSTMSSTYRHVITYPALYVPKDATVVSAIPRYRAGGSSGSLNIERMVFTAESNPTHPSNQSEADAISNFTSGADWTISGSWVNETYYYGPDLKASLQEIVDRPDWTMGNKLQQYVYDNGSTPGDYHYGYGNEYYDLAVTYIAVNSYGAPVADFTNVADASNSFSINFTDLSLLTPTSWDWSWGDGSSNGTTQNPSHLYADSSSFSVTLTATNAYGSSSITKSVPVALIEDFAPHNMTNSTSPAPFVADAESTYYTGEYPPYKAFDGSTYFLDIWLSGGIPAWLSLDIGEGNAKTLCNYSILGSNGLAAGGMPKNWTMEGSNDNLAWDVLDTVTDETSWTNSGEVKNYVCDVITAAYRYFRINVSANNGYVTGIYMPELYLFGY